MSTITALRQLDELRILAQPYSAHYVANKDEVTRCHYTALLLMVLLSEELISEQQQRMLDLWLPSVGLAGRQAELCSLAGRLALDQLGEAIALLRRDGRLIRGLLLDIMIFARLDKPLGDEKIALLEALAGYFQIDELEISNIVYLATIILGLPTELLSEPPLYMDLSPYKVWDEFLYHYRSALCLFKWADANKIPSNILPRNVSALSKVKKLSNRDYTVEGAIIQWDRIPDELGLLSGLEELCVDSNLLNEVPKSIGGVKKLKCLRLLSFKGKVLPIELSKLVALQLLEIKIGVGLYTPFSWGGTNEISIYVPKKVVEFIKCNGVKLDVSPSIESFFK